LCNVRVVRRVVEGGEDYPLMGTGVGKENADIAIGRDDCGGVKEWGLLLKKGFCINWNGQTVRGFR